MPRFVVDNPIPENKDVWHVVDKDAKKYNMPEKAVSINMRFSSALRISETLNQEWEEFLRNPS